MTRFLCTGDSHLGKSIGLYPERLAEQERVWEWTLQLARERKVDAVLHAGDLFDQRRPGPDVVLAAERPLVKHRRLNGPPVIAVAGNHDIPSIGGPCGLDVLAEAGLVELARGNRVIQAGAAQVCCLPWAPPHAVLAQHDADARHDLLAQIAELLVNVAASMRRDGRRQVLLGHWSATGSALPNGMDVAQLGGVVIPTDAIAALGFDAVVLGHIHRSQTMDTDGSLAFYTGSPMPLDHGEEDVWHGAQLLELHDDGSTSVSYLEIPSRRFITIDIDPHIGELSEWPDIEGAVVRARVHADETDRIDTTQIRDDLIAAGAHVVTAVTINVMRAERERPAAVTEDITPHQALAAYLAHRGINGTVGTAATELASRYLEGSRA